MLQKITMIQAQKRVGRYNIYLDGTYSFSVSEDVLIKFQLSKGQELTKEQISNLTDADSFSKDYNRAINYLSRQLRTEKEVSDYLIKNDVNPETIEQILIKLRSLNLVNDLFYSQSYVRTVMNTSDKGPSVIRQKLRLKGITESLIDDALTQFTQELQLEKAVLIAKKLAAHYHNQSFSTLKNKIHQNLLVKGFNSDITSLALTELDLKKEQSNELSLLTTQAVKLLHRYRRFSAKECKQKTIAALYRKGFTFDDITQVLTNIAEENNTH
ncbi:recombination regulator RecX [Ligilactobacillus sp. WILCCON 0076]|uniref:Regulatory protein RecX n=1 Tax=Ligilactobacillus ubinensis TaxID=2876789 RepID=A0A9X2JMI1_9LACO|nr:recombination regulator RecX [Ligilactobacillus ubinensis]MCP0887939.1 recombination regulator RecX [Ligilactobacillus ubinensis]